MISVASSIKFRKDDGLLPSFDNTLLEDQLVEGGISALYVHKVYTDDVLTIQASVDTGYTVAFYYSEECYKAWAAVGGETLEVSGATYDIYEVAINFATFAGFQSVMFKMEILDRTTVIETWYSEPCELTTESDDDGLLQVEFFNIDNAFEVDYSTGIAHLLRIEAQMREYKPGGESSVFDNQQEVTKIRDEVKRSLVFKTEPIPAYLAEMLRVAVAHDKFFINEVEYVAESNADYEANASNLGIFSVTLTQRNVVGLNTHDIGYDCDSTTNSDTMVLQELAASGQVSFTIPEGYIVATVTGIGVTGSPVIKAGTSPGGDEVVYSMAPAVNVSEVTTVNSELSPTGDTTLYVDISGTGATADIYVLLFKNRQ